ncbi:MAG: aminotransferase class V-fold PLP-dependent enzyme [Lachnospiraceae bacterium]|nr:aminotransferase class V-fold PLP-dependent enzyme [Lachnospiraceae bacterium]
MKYKNNLLHKLHIYGADGPTPFHMPGHKRNDELSPHFDAYGIDITEIDGFDDLHHPDGCLKSAMERAAGIFGSRETFFLINGCTGGILAAIHAVCKRGDHILLADNSHKSAYNAAMLNGLTITRLTPKGGLCGLPLGTIQPDDVENALGNNPAINCVFITSPTYEGVISDISSIAEIAHRHNAVVIVDEAHGAHMLFSPIFPKSAVECGADIVIHGIHKTLPSLTQTALLHIVTERVDTSEIKRYLSIFQSSSPSYILMGSIDYCMDMLEQDADGLYFDYAKRLTGLYKKLSHLHNLELLPYGDTRDASKIVISTRRCGMDVLSLYTLLREKYRIQPELSLPEYVILMTSVCDSEDTLALLEDAITEIDNTCTDNMSCDGIHRTKAAAMTGKNVWHAKPGDTADDTLYVYPPGIPIIMAGEIYTEEIIDRINDYCCKGYKIKGNGGLF